MSTEGHGEAPSIVPSLPGVPEQMYLFPKSKGHSRSVSHGGTPCGPLAPPAPRPPLKSALRGHQRAFSHGQIGEAPTPAPTPGHTRSGSRADFILPPGHREPAPGSAPRPAVRTRHSRQASRSESIYTLRRESIVGPWRKIFAWVTRRQVPMQDNTNLIVTPNHLVPDKIPPKLHPNAHRSDNKVTTTKYTLLSFIPKNLLEQFHRIANLYFIFIVLLNWVPSINAFGKEVAMFPLLFVLGVTSIKDLFEDRRRHLSDKRVNNSFCRIYKGSANRYVRVKWREVRVGDLVHLSNNEAVPADLVLLSSSNPSGVCYLDTGNLDGETNLKQRVVAPGFIEKHPVFDAGKFRSTVEVDRPSTKLYRFNGCLAHPGGGRVPLGSEHLLLRESRLRNTDYVEGIVVYAGHETKALLNNGGPRYKRSKLERRVNTEVVWCVLVLLALCCAGAVGCKVWLDAYHLRAPPPFVPYAYGSAYEGLLAFWTYIIVLQIMIPISLYVTIEVAKLLQVYHIHQDAEMYDPVTNSRPECRALNITEELGQISYLFSDKTGTLTENKMLFRACALEGVDYDHPPGPPAEPDPRLPPIVTPQSSVSPNARLLAALGPDADPQLQQKVKEFFLILALCNTVMVGLPHVDNMAMSGTTLAPKASKGNASLAAAADKYARLAESRSTTPSPPPATGIRFKLSLRKLEDGVPATTPTVDAVPSVSTPDFKLSLRKLEDGVPATTPTVDAAPSTMSRYEAESPDDLALVEAAFAYGYELRRRTPDAALLGVRGRLVGYSVLRVQEFDSARKCMSIAVRPEGQDSDSPVTLYVKGADSVILAALAGGGGGGGVAARTRALVADYSRAGLRTLLLARRTLSAAQWDEWRAQHHRAMMAGEGRERRVRESLASLESGLTLAGATGVEDRLQEGVPRTVRALLDAGVVVWVLTGDKPETAVNVAYSARLFAQGDRLLHLMSRDKEHAEAMIAAYLAGGAGGRGLVVDGRTLTYILDRRSGLVTPFLSLARRCSAVLCCRATPLQKAYIVKAVKEELDVTTLAVGDGANDVSMIQTADVGVGLSGQEGRQAVMASDFALSRFKYLERLLLVHGHWSYDRLAKMIIFFLLKNSSFVFLVFWFQLYNGFSSSVMIDEMHLMVYNLMFTAIPPLVIGVYDRVAPSSLLLARPGLYSASRRGLAYTAYTYWFILAEAIYISVVIFFANLYTFWNTTVDLKVFGMCCMMCCLTAMLSYVAVETRSWTVIHVLALLASLGSFFAFALLVDAGARWAPALLASHRALPAAAALPAFWLLAALCAVAALAPRLFVRAVRNSLCPSNTTRGVLAHRDPRRPRAAPPQHYRATGEYLGGELTAVT